MATLGNELRQRREAKGISLGEIADTTRIGVRFLQAIETDDFKSLPGGLFNRSFIRAYARAVGLNEEDALTAYQKQTGAPSPLSDSQLKIVPQYTVTPEREINWAPAVMTAVVFGILAVGGYAMYRHFNRPPVPTVQTPTVPEPAPAPATNPNGPPPILTGGTPPPAPTPTPQPVVQALPITLEVAATGDCYVRADIDGKPAEGLILKIGESRKFEATEKMALRLGKIGNVTVKLNGADVTLPSPDGNKSDVLITLKDGVPNVEAVKRRIPKPTAPTTTPDAGGTTTTPPPSNGTPQ